MSYTPFKMKGWSPFTQKTHPDHPVTPPSKKETEISKGTLKGQTKFESDFPIVSKIHKETNPVTQTKRILKDLDLMGKYAIKKGKQVKDYFTER